jgi:hypothetical protein
VDLVLKVAVKDYGIWLYAENPAEDTLLETLDKQGIRVCARSTDGISISSPETAGLRQLFINREQQAMLCYSVKAMEQLVASKLIFQQNMPALKGIRQIAANLMDLLDQLFVAPEPVTPRAIPLLKSVMAKEKPKEEP